MTSFDWFRAVAKLLVGISWPAAALIAICILRNPLRSILSAIASLIGKSKLKFPGGFEVVPVSEDLARKDTVSAARPEMAVSDSRQTEVEEFFRLISQATRLANSNRHKEAVGELKTANRILPNQWLVLHNMAVSLIRLGKSEKCPEYCIEAESVCRVALAAAPSFPYGTLYNLARAQAAGGNIVGLRETFEQLKLIKLPENLAGALAKGDVDFEDYPNVTAMPEYQVLKQHWSQEVA